MHKKELCHWPRAHWNIIATAGEETLSITTAAAVHMNSFEINMAYKLVL